MSPTKPSGEREFGFAAPALSLILAGASFSNACATAPAPRPVSAHTVEDTDRQIEAQVAAQVARERERIGGTVQGNPLAAPGINPVPRVEIVPEGIEAEYIALAKKYLSDRGVFISDSGKKRRAEQYIAHTLLKLVYIQQKGAAMAEQYKTKPNVAAFRKALAQKINDIKAELEKTAQSLRNPLTMFIYYLKGGFDHSARSFAASEVDFVSEDAKLRSFEEHMGDFRRDF